jgi:hypothetical protein
MASKRKQQQVLLLILLVACIGLSIAIIVIQSSDQEHVVTGLDKDSVSQIKITRSNGESVSLALQNKQWQITHPKAQLANTNRVEPLLSIAAIAPSYTSDEVDRTAAGLTTPIATILFNDKHFDIGELDVSGKRRYAESDGQVYFFPEWIAPLIDGGVNAFATDAEQ